MKIEGMSNPRRMLPAETRILNCLPKSAVIICDRLRQLIEVAPQILRAENSMRSSPGLR